MRDKSPRVKCHERLQKRFKGQANLNLTSLMDIFTILVFFLLVSTSNPSKLPDASKLKLPVSLAETEPKETIVVMITKEDILVQGMKIGSVNEILRARLLCSGSSSHGKKPLIRCVDIIVSLHAQPQRRFWHSHFGYR